MITGFPGFPTQATRSSHPLCVFFHYTTPIQSWTGTQITSGRKATTTTDRQRKLARSRSHEEEKVLTH